MKTFQALSALVVLLCWAGAAVADPNLCARVKCDVPKNSCRVAVCEKSTGKCVVRDRDNGHRCDDNNKCTFNDKCRDGKCVGATLVCPETKNKCTTNLCNPLTGRCVVVAQRNGKACDDGKACTTDDKCRAGRCVGTPKLCAGPTPCKSSKCVEPTGACVDTARPDGARCFDADKCSVNSTCTAGICSGGVPKNCTSTQCIDRKCNPATGICDPTFLSGKACNDGMNCTSNDVCTPNGVCKGTATVCPATPTTQCTRLRCNELTGTCDVINRANGTSCDDGNKCTIRDTCTNGVCAGTPKLCTSGNQCVSKTCNPATGVCDPTFLSGKTCDDGKKCTSNDVCTNGVCKGTPLVCPASAKQCMQMACSEKTGTCALEALPNGHACDDMNLGTFNDRCFRGVCKSTKCPVPGNRPCIVIEYNPLTGTCESKLRPDGTSCNDGKSSTRNDVCKNGVCKGN